MNCTNKRNRIVTVLILAALLLTVGCESQQSAKSRIAPSGQYDYRHIELDNGMDVITLEDFSCPIVSVQVWYHVGAKNEQPDRQGFAHMFEHMMFRGTDLLGPTDHFSLIRRTGGNANGYTGFDRTVYLETLPADQIELALWLEAERMTFLKIDQQAFDTERKVVEEERRMGLNDTYGTVVEKLLPHIYKVHPYRWLPIGNIAHLRSATVQELRDFWYKFYTPSNATLIIVGDIEHAKAQQLAKKYFGWIPKYDAPAPVSIVEPEPKGPKSITLYEENAPAPALGLVYRTVPLKHEDTIPIDLLAEILGGGNSSRLYRQLVAEKQLAVAAQAISWSLEQDGLFGAGAVLSPVSPDPNAVLELIEAQIQRLRTEPVTELELTKAKNQMLRGQVTQNLKIESKARMLGNAAVEIDDISYVNRQLDNIRKVTAADIMRVANKYLTPSRALKGNVRQSPPGAVSDKNKEEELAAAVTAEAEIIAPKPGRPGLTRPESFPKQAPIAKVAPARLTPNYSTEKLENGLKVLVVPNHEVPFITVQLGLLSGAWIEDKPATAAMTMKMLTKGTEKHTEAQLAQELETYAISLGGGGSMDTSTIAMSCLTEQMTRGMKLLGEVVFSPTFPSDEFEKLRKQVRTSLAISSAEPRYQVEKEFRRRLYGQHPYFRTAIGEVEDVDALVIDDLKNWWQTFARPDLAVLIIAGDINKSRAVELAKQTFGSWQADTPAPEKNLPNLEPLGPTHIYLVDKPNSTQSQIRIGQRGITRHNQSYFVSRLVSSYFGWGFDSRLNKSIRVEKGLTYGVWGSYIAQRFAGEFKIGTFSKTETTAETVQAVIDEIKLLKTTAPAESELENSRSYILGSFVQGRETPQQIAGDLWLIESQQLDSDYLEKLLTGIAEAETADCQRLIDNTVLPENLVVVVLGDAKKLKEKLEKIAPVTIIESPSS